MLFSSNALLFGENLEKQSYLEENDKKFAIIGRECSCISSK